jgi:uncharacterized protein (TIGR02466 family)
MSASLLNEVIPFQTKFYWANLPDQSHLIPFVRNLRDCDVSDVVISNRGGWQSPPYNRGQISEFDPLFDLVYEHVSEAYEQFGIKKKPKDGGFWVNINKKYDYNISHNHPSAFFAAVVYLKSPNKSGDFVMERPDALDDFLRVDERTPNSYCTWRIPTDENKLLIFPAYVRHYVEQNLTDEQDDERISIAFNFG